MNQTTKHCQASLNLSASMPRKILNLVLIVSTLLSVSQPVFSSALSDWVEDKHTDWVEDIDARPAPRMFHGSKYHNLRSDNLVVPAKTRFTARLERSLDSRVNIEGEQVKATLTSPLSKKDTLLVPPGSVLTGQITRVVAAHRGFGANGRVEITFTSINTPEGQVIPILATVDTGKLARAGGAASGRLSMTLKRTALGALGGAAVGAAVGAVGAAMSPGYSPYYVRPWGPYYGYNYSFGYYQRPSYGTAMSYGAAAGAAAGLGAGLISAGMKAGHDIHVAEGTPIQCRLQQDLKFDLGIAQNNVSQPGFKQALSFQTAETNSYDPF
jgi:hypothetical protein